MSMLDTLRQAIEAGDAQRALSALDRLERSLRGNFNAVVGEPQPTPEVVAGTDWSQYGPCPTCDADTGKECMIHAPTHWKRSYPHIRYPHIRRPLNGKFIAEKTSEISQDTCEHGRTTRHYVIAPTSTRTGAWCNGPIHGPIHQATPPLTDGDTLPTEDQDDQDQDHFKIQPNIASDLQAAGWIVHVNGVSHLPGWSCSICKCFCGNADCEGGHSAVQSCNLRASRWQDVKEKAKAKTCPRCGKDLSAGGDRGHWAFDSDAGFRWCQ